MTEKEPSVPPDTDDPFAYMERQPLTQKELATVESIQSITIIEKKDKLLLLALALKVIQGVVRLESRAFAATNAHKAKDDAFCKMIRGQKLFIDSELRHLVGDEENQVFYRYYIATTDKTLAGASKETASSSLTAEQHQALKERLKGVDTQLF